MPASEVTVKVLLTPDEADAAAEACQRDAASASDERVRRLWLSAERKLKRAIAAQTLPYA